MEAMVVLLYEVVLAMVTLLFVTTKTPMGWLVALNGVACHGSMAVGSRWAPRLRQFDVGSNLLMAAYANAHPCGWPEVPLGTVFAFAVWRFNQLNRPGVRKATMHAVGVQLPLLISLHKFKVACLSLK